VNVAAILLAAGKSRRMGGQNKLLLEFRGEAIILHALKALLAAKISPLIVVTGHDAENVSAAIGTLDCECVYNPDYELGMSTSIKAGMATVPESSEAVLVALGDMPGVKAQSIRQLCHAARNPAFDVIVPTYKGAPGHPVMWKRAAFTGLLLSKGDRGAKLWLQENSARVQHLPVEDHGVVLDIDTPEAWQQFQDRPKA
jgi:molybdenum cofactor cytidylyltransferase